MFSESGTLSGKALGTQKFTTGKGATVTCSEAALSGSVSAGKAASVLLSSAYSGCKVTGLSGAATVSLADYTLFAPNPSSLISILNLIMIEAGPLGVECDISIASGQSLGSASGELVYKSIGTTSIELQANIAKIESEVIKSNSKALCGSVGEKSTTGQYEGDVEIGLNSKKGTILVLNWSVGESGGQPVWLIDGSTLKSGESRTATTPAGGFAFYVYIEGTQLELQCSDATASVLFDGGEPGTDKNSMTFKGCKVVKPTGCSSASEFTLESSTKLVEEGGKIYDVFQEDKGDKIVIEGAECALKGTLSLVGTFKGEVVGETIAFIKEAGTLEVVRTNEGKEFKYPAEVADGSAMELML